MSESTGREESRHRLLEALLAIGVEAVLADIADTTSLNEDLGIESFQLTEVARHLEEAYDLRFTLVDWVLAEGEGESPQFSVGSLLDYIASQLGADETSKREP